jgi:hypothetical protein
MYTPKEGLGWSIDDQTTGGATRKIRSYAFFLFEPETGDVL